MEEFIIKDEHLSDDEHYNNPNDLLDKSVINCNRAEERNDTQLTEQDFDSDEDLAGIQLKLRREQQNPTPKYSQSDFGEDPAEKQRNLELYSERQTVEKQPTYTNQPTLSKECAICQKHFNNRPDFVNHARKYHPNEKAFKCTVCSLVFVNIQSVSRHSKNHKDINRVKKHICEICSKTFLHRDTFKRHLEVHDEGRIYVCTICNISYKTQYSLKKHQKTHLEMDGNNANTTDYKIADANDQVTFEANVEDNAKDNVEDNAKDNVEGNVKDNVEGNVEDNISFITLASIKQEENVTIPLDIQIELDLHSAMDVTKTEYTQEEQLLEVKNEEDIFEIEYVDEQHVAEQLENLYNINETQLSHMTDATNITNESDISREARHFKTMSIVDTKCAVCLQEFTTRQDLIDHAQQYHPNAKAFKCITCSMRFSNILSISRHRRIHKNVPKIVCSYCSKSFWHKDDHRRHVTKVHSIEVTKETTLPAVDRKCAVCNEEFPFRRDLIKHAREFHPDGKAFKCTVCSMVFKNAHYISRHRRNHKNLPRKYHCDSCFKTFRDVDIFKRHLKVHKAETSYHCSVCNRYFKYKESFEQHLLMHEAEEQKQGDLEKVVIKDELVNESVGGDLVKTSIEKQNNMDVEYSQIPLLKIQRVVETKCAVCKKEFQSRQDLVKHVQLEHPNDRAYKCSICPRVFKNIHYLSRHRRSHKNLPRKYVCETCAMTFRDADNFHRHLKIHARPRSYQCTICFNSYKDKVSMENHLKSHMEKSKAKEQEIKKLRSPISSNFKRPVEMKCAVCQQQFNYRFELVDHVKLNHPYDKAFKCSLCPMLFTNICEISAHRNMHKIFGCKMCSKSFTCRDDLKLHIRVHTKERPYCCFVCKTTYKRRTSWLRHKACHCKANKINKPHLAFRAQFEEAELNKNLDNFTDIHWEPSLIDNRQNELEMYTEDKEDEQILPVNREDNQLEDVTNEPHPKSSADNEKSNKGDGFLLEEMADEEVIQSKRLSVENKNYELLENNNDINDSQQINKRHENDDDHEEENYDDDENYDYDELEEGNDELEEEHDELEEDNDEEMDEEEDDDHDYNIDNNDDYDGFLLENKTGPQNKRPMQDDNLEVKNKDDINYANIINNSNISAVDTKCAVCQQECDTRKNLTAHAIKCHPNENAFKCKDCLLVFKSFHAVSSHVRSHGRQIIDTKCGVCAKEFVARHELVKHAEEFHPNERAIKCALCPRVFKSTTCISSHRRSHKNMPKKYICGPCHTSFSDIGNYRAHLRSKKHKIAWENEQKYKLEKGDLAEYHDKNIRKYVCPYCSLSMVEEEDFRRHIQTHINMGYRTQLIVDTKCAVCQERFSCRQELLDHAKLFHPNDKAFKCALCPMVFRNIVSVSAHRGRVHKLEPKKYNCKVCKKFITQESVKAHLKSQRHEFFLKEFQRTRSQKFSNEFIKDNLSKTTNSNEENKETSLEICQEPKSSEVFNNSQMANEIDRDIADLGNCDIEEDPESNDAFKDDLDINETKLIDNNVVINAADEEDNTFDEEDSIMWLGNNNTSQNLLPSKDGCRTETVSNIKDCNICGESFISVAHLRRHLSVHSLERNYPCSFCEKRYKRKDDMRTHQRKVHFNLLLALAEKTLEAEETHHEPTVNLETHQKRSDYLKDTNDEEDDPSDLRSIIQNDIKERPFKCPFCYRRFSQKCRMRKHKEQFHSDRLQSSREKTKNKEKNLEISKKTSSSKASSSFTNQESILSYEDSIHSQNIVTNTDDMDSQKKTTNVAEKSCSVNVLEISKTECEVSHAIPGTEFHNNALNSIENESNKTIKPKEDNSTDVQDRPTTNDNEDLLEILTDLPSTSQSLRNERSKPDLKGLLYLDKKCAVCKKEFICCQEFLKHVQLSHPNSKAFKCTLCPNAFSKLSSIQHHHRKFHTETGVNQIIRPGDNYQKHLQENDDEESDEDTMSFNSLENKSIDKLESENNSDEDVLSKTKEKHCTEGNNSQDDSEMEDAESGTSYSYQNTPYDEDEYINSIIKYRERKTPMIENKCVVCFKEFEFQRDLVEHAQQLHPGIKALKCRNCDVTFRNSNSISRHFRIHKTLTKKYICEFCYKPFPFKDYLQSHIKKTHFTIGGNHTCDVCKRTFKHIDGLNQHKKIHLPQKSTDGDTVLNKSENVEQEEFITTTSANEAEQIKEANTLEINSVASEAEEDEDQISKSVTETLNKFKSRHRLLLGKCGFCKMTINNYREFVKHLAEFHPDFKAFKCKKCDHHFPSTGSLKYHNYYCHSEKREKHICNICSQSFDGVRKLRDHLLTHEDDPFKCKICENVFSNKKSLAAHMYYSHSEKRKRHICHICSKEFNRVSNLKGHMNIHTDERPIRCNVCDKRFKDMRQLKSHQRVHEARKIQYPTEDVDQQHDDSQQFEQITDINEGGETLNLEYGYGHVKPEPNLNESLNDNS